MAGLVRHAAGQSTEVWNGRGGEDEEHLQDHGSPEPRRGLQRGSRLPVAHNGSGYISQPRTKATATNPPNIIAPVRSWARGSSRSSTEKTSDTKKANNARRRMWLVTSAPCRCRRRRG